MKQQEAFTVETPTIKIRGKSIKLRSVNQGIGRISEAVQGLVGKDNLGEVARATVIAFAACYSLPPAEAAKLVLNPKMLEKAIAEADMELSDPDVRAVDEYLDGVFSRARNSAITVAKAVPGKSSARATSRSRSPRK